MKITRHRDLTLIDINNDQFLVISCDSSGGIGNKENDVVKVSPEIVGYYTTQVALMEILAFGAKPITIVDTLSVEMSNTGEKIINGIKQVLEPLNFDISNLVTGSTEENIPVSQTGMGITIIGIVDKNKWRKPYTQAGLLSVVVGLPKVGDEVIADKNKTIMSVSKLLELKEKEYIKEILPVGSRGILYELEQMAKTNNINFELENETNIDLKKSGGPSTCVIISIEESKYEEFKKSFSIPVNKIGRFI
ncbi:alpha-ribazole kinase [Gottschalkia purinilytica]|uniref:Alpha-ribazole kinase n=1 Tax=Gottschalkia purinilytica TaxID=1503 RepID=A0A0L0W8N2_GOTPU|nr:AIR synthase related protein [Gottschalkia purinilytica]KNF07904.1 alpha-ribazole kinase [Gottschalkia purinilytica]